MLPWLAVPASHGERRGPEEEAAGHQVPAAPGFFMIRLLPLIAASSSAPCPATG